MTLEGYKETPFDPHARGSRKSNGRAERSIIFEPATDIVLDTRSEYLAKGLVHPGDASVLFGQSGCGKTFLALHMGHAIATGRSFFGRRVQSSPVVLFALEGSAGLAKRVTAIQAEHGPAPNLLIHRKPITLFRNADIVDEVVVAIREAGARVAIFDTLSRTMSGADENGPADMTHMVGVFDRIRAQTGAHTMLVHHGGKNELAGARGHSSLRAAVDVEMEVEVLKETGQRVLRLTKGRDDADGREHGFKLKVIDLGVDGDGDPITTCVVEELGEGEQIATKKGRSLSAQHRQALEILREAINEFGERGQVGVPSQFSAIRRRTWVDAAVKRMLGPSDDATDKAITRALPVLRDAKLIGTSTPWIWVTSK